MMPSLELALAADEGYAQHAAAVVRSVLRHHAPDTTRFHFLHPDQPGPNLAALCAFIRESGATVHLVNIPPQWADRLEHHRYFGTHMWLRLLLPELLPDLRRVLYLDCDLIVNAPLTPLWTLDLAGKAIAAVRNPFYPHQSAARLRQFGITDADKYFNSGVLLMQLDQLRAMNATETLVQFASDHRDQLQYPDQDVLNAVLWPHCCYLPPTYNAQAVLFDLPTDQLPFSAAETLEARKHPVIVHFSGMLKPWLHACGHPYRRLYWENLHGTPWENARPLHPRWRNILLRHLGYRARRLVWKYFPQIEVKRPVAPTPPQ